MNRETKGISKVRTTFQLNFFIALNFTSDYVSPVFNSDGGNCSILLRYRKHTWKQFHVPTTENL